MNKEINTKGICVNEQLIVIDYTIWTTQALLAKKLGVSRQVIGNRIARAGVRTYYIEQLGIRLIPNVLNINDL